jgi:hypothetical protein
MRTEGSATHLGVVMIGTCVGQGCWVEDLVSLHSSKGGKQEDQRDNQCPTHP